MQSSKQAAYLVLEDNTVFSGFSFGAGKSSLGEVVFNTGMVGYPETLTDPSYRGQLLTFTYPLIGNYGVPDASREQGLLTHFESDQIHAAGIIVADYSAHYSHWSAVRSLSNWMQEQNLPGIYGIDTRKLTQILREKGTMMGSICMHPDERPMEILQDFHPVQQVSTPHPKHYGSGAKK